MGLNADQVRRERPSGRGAGDDAAGGRSRVSPRQQFLGWRTVKPYSDERFGEVGVVYHAADFNRCPTSLQGKAFRYALEDGGRMLRDRQLDGRFGSHAAARAAGATIVKLPAHVAWQWKAA